MEQNLIIQICERLASVEAKVNILMTLQGAVSLGIISIAINRIFKKNGNDNSAK